MKETIGQNVFICDRCGQHKPTDGMIILPSWAIQDADGQSKNIMYMVCEDCYKEVCEKIKEKQ